MTTSRKQSKPSGWHSNVAYVFIILFTLLISPIVIVRAAKQGKKNKTRIKNVLLLLLICQIILGAFNWENFSVGRSGYELSLTYPNSLLGLFFIISTMQIVFLVAFRSLQPLVSVLNFTSTVLIFTAMIRLSSISGFQAVSFASIGATFLVLSGNVLGLVLINKDKSLQKKYPFRK